MQDFSFQDLKSGISCCSLSAPSHHLADAWMHAVVGFEIFAMASALGAIFMNVAVSLISGHVANLLSEKISRYCLVFIHTCFFFHRLNAQLSLHDASTVPTVFGSFRDIVIMFCLSDPDTFFRSYTTFEMHIAVRPFEQCVFLKITHNRLFTFKLFHIRHGLPPHMR